MAGGFNTSGFGTSWFDINRPGQAVAPPKAAPAVSGQAVSNPAWTTLQTYATSEHSVLTRLMAYLAGSAADPALLAPAMVILQETEGTIRTADYRSPTNDFEADKRALRAAKLDRPGQALLEVLHAETLPATELALPRNLSVLSRAIDALGSKDAPQIGARGLYHLAQGNEHFWQNAKSSNAGNRATPSDLGMDEYERILALNEKFPGCVSRSILAATHFNIGRFKSLSNLGGSRIYSRPEAEESFFRAEQLAPGFLEGKSAAEWAHLGFQDAEGNVTNPEVVREQGAMLVTPSVIHGVFKVLERRKNDLSDTVARIAQMNLSNRNAPDQVIAAVTGQDAAPYTGIAYESPIGGDRRSDLWRLSRFSNHPSVQAAAEIALARTLGQSYRAVQLAHYRRAKTSVPEAMSPQLHAFASFNIGLCEGALTPEAADKSQPLPDGGAASMVEVKRLAERYPDKIDKELLGKAIYNLAVDQMKPRHPAYDLAEAKTNLLLSLRYSTNPVVQRAARTRLIEIG